MANRMSMGAHPGGAVTRVLGPDAPRGLGLAALAGSRDLVWLFVRRDLKLRHTQSLLGPVWLVLQPLVPAVLFTFVFTKVTTVDTGGIPYLLIVACGMVPWAVINRSLLRGSGALVGDRSLVTKVWFPRLAVLIAVVIGAVIDYLVALAIVFVAMALNGWAPTWRIAALPLLALWSLLLSLGVASLVAALGVTRRDILYVLPVVTQVWLYVSPVGYPHDLVPGPRMLLLLNPLAGLAELHRWCLLGRADVSIGVVAGAAASTVVLVLAGLLAFKRADRVVADVL